MISFQHCSSLLGVLWILVFSASNHFCQAFVPQCQLLATSFQTAIIGSSSPTRLYSTENDNDSSSSSFMASLKERMKQVSKNDNILPIVVLDAMLPRQVLNITIQNSLLLEMVRTRWSEETPTFGMVGRARMVMGDGAITGMTLTHGVEVEILGQPRVVKTPEGQKLQLSLKGGRRFKVQQDTVDVMPQGWTQATVEFLNSTMDDTTESSTSDPMSIARAMQMAREFTDPNFSMAESQSLVDMWLSLARQRERSPGQIDGILQDLGPMPSWKSPSECALWVGALINPIPALGVALEIRPKLLLAKTAEDRTQIALDGIWNSIQHMQGHDRFQQIKE